MVKVVIVALVAVLLVSTASGCDLSGYESTSEQEPAETLRILEYESGVCYSSPCVIGIAKNVCAYNLSYAEVRVKWYDDAGTLLDTSLDNINDLAPGETWQFEILYYGLSQKVQKYRIEVGTILCDR